MNFYEQLVHQAGSNFYRYAYLYQSGKAPVEVSEKDKAISYEEKIKRMVRAVQDAEVVIVGAASGMSTAAGQDYYYDATPNFKKYFGKYGKKYGYQGAFAGVYYPYNTREEYWGFLINLLHLNIHAPAGQPYHDLDAILGDKDFHVITTNQDTQFTRLYSDDKISSIQGDFRYFQCSRTCCDEVFDVRDKIDSLFEEIDEDLKIPKEKIPRCPHCGAEMSWWVRGENFLQGKKYHGEYDKAADYIAANKDKKILFLELGVGRMTPMFIQEPFWNLTLNLPQAFYISINPKDAILPKQLEEKGIAIHEDIAKALHDVRACQTF